jgi:sigma-B regulation protein RsbU (phosphoserine phosphatase)
MQSKRIEPILPSAIMDDLNQVLCDSNQVLMMTFFILRIDTKTRELLYSNASHEFPIVLSNTGKSNQLIEKPQARLGHKKESQYKNYSYKLLDSDILFLYTDGLTECPNTEDQFFGFRRVESIMKKNNEKGTKEISDCIVSEVKKFNHNQPFQDDVGFLVIKT